MEKIIKGLINNESWVERIALSKKIKTGTRFSTAGEPVQHYNLCFWTPLDAQPCFEVAGNDEVVKLPEELTLTSDEDLTLTIHHPVDVTDKVPVQAKFTYAEDSDVRYLNLTD